MSHSSTGNSHRRHLQFGVTALFAVMLTVAAFCSGWACKERWNRFPTAQPTRGQGGVVTARTNRLIAALESERAQLEKRIRLTQTQLQQESEGSEDTERIRRAIERGHTVLLVPDAKRDASISLLNSELSTATSLRTKISARLLSLRAQPRTPLPQPPVPPAPKRTLVGTFDLGVVISLFLCGFLLGVLVVHRPAHLGEAESSTR